MRALRDAYSATNQTDSKSLYLFMFAGGDTKNKLQGDMPLKSKFGYIFNVKESTAENTARTIAHELAHGYFEMRHTFSKKYKIVGSKGTTPNLMDYSSGIELIKYQWDVLHDPQKRLFDWAQSEGEGQEAEMNNVVFTSEINYFSDSEPTLPGSELGEYRIAYKNGTNKEYGYIWNGANSGWKECPVIEYSIGEKTFIRGSNGDNDKKPYPDIYVDFPHKDDYDMHLKTYKSFFLVGIDQEGDAARKEGEVLMNKFLTGDNSTYSYPPNSIVSRFLFEDNEFQKVARNFNSHLREWFKKHGKIDGFKGNRYLSWAYIKDRIFMYAIMGGTQRWDAKLMFVNSKQVVVQYTVWDRYDAGTEDAGRSDLPGLLSMFWLQHRSGRDDIYKPFIWNIKVNTKSKKRTK